MIQNFAPIFTKQSIVRCFLRLFKKTYTMDSIYFWIIFNVFVLLMLALDLFVFHRKAHEVKGKEALLTSLFWIALASILNVIIYYWIGDQSAMDCLIGYLIENTICVENAS